MKLLPLILVLLSAPLLAEDGNRRKETRGRDGSLISVTTWQGNDGKIRDRNGALLFRLHRELDGSITVRDRGGRFVRKEPKP